MSTTMKKVIDCLIELVYSLVQKGRKMFRGKFETAIDTEGKIDFSPFFLDELKKHKKYALATTRADPCLSLYPIPYKKIIDIMEEEISFSKPAKIREGIVVVPQSLLKYAKLKKKIFLVGCGEKIEIWDERAWEEVVKEAQRGFREIRKIFRKLGL